MNFIIYSYQNGHQLAIGNSFMNLATDNCIFLFNLAIFNILFAILKSVWEYPIATEILATSTGDHHNAKPKSNRQSRPAS